MALLFCGAVLLGDRITLDQRDASVVAALTERGFKGAKVEKVSILGRFWVPCGRGLTSDVRHWVAAEADGYVCAYWGQPARVYVERRGRRREASR